MFPPIKSFSRRVFFIRSTFRANYLIFRNTSSCPISVFFFRVFSYHNMIFSQIMTSNINLLTVSMFRCYIEFSPSSCFQRNIFFSFRVVLYQVVLLFMVLPLVLFFNSELLLPRVLPKRFLNFFFLVRSFSLSIQRFPAPNIFPFRFSPIRVLPKVYDVHSFTLAREITLGKTNDK